MIAVATPNPAARRTTAVAEAGTLPLDPPAPEVGHRALRAPAIAQAHQGIGLPLHEALRHAAAAGAAAVLRPAAGEIDLSAYHRFLNGASA